ncbi:arrestin domain-containing protein 3-like protein [Dinothrombium tinctorium]|uniref:Arrestin domain-containing protein 3-like protein n=1 Tax=Dinothrombium tinctorium TaxID=1965070 RepID=A0A3S3P8V3_9ACAR|nr:arrestin domain-containing protein 3-like protein [Dinothrombium tinctorium]
MGKLKAFEIVFENNKNVYFPGDNVAGKCVLELRGGEFKLNQIKILMRGVAKVHWTEPRSTGNRLGSYNEHFSAEIEYFLLKKVLHGDTECGENGELVLDAGCHEFPFSFQLPSSGLPTSFEGKHGSIRYWIKAEVEKRWAFNDKTKKAFTVISKIDINRSEYLV